MIAFGWSAAAAVERASMLESARRITTNKPEQDFTAEKPIFIQSLNSTYIMRNSLSDVAKNFELTVEAFKIPFLITEFYD